MEEIRQVAFKQHGARVTLMDKVEVTGPGAHPVWKYLTGEQQFYLNIIYLSDLSLSRNIRSHTAVEFLQISAGPSGQHCPGVATADTSRGVYVTCDLFLTIECFQLLSGHL